MDEIPQSRARITIEVAVMPRTLSVTATLVDSTPIPLQSTTVQMVLAAASPDDFLGVVQAAALEGILSKLEDFARATRGAVRSSGSIEDWRAPEALAEVLRALHEGIVRRRGTADARDALAADGPAPGERAVGPPLAVA
jgi:hypothetical protein